MTTKQENQLAVKGTVEKRVRDSLPLLERMGITPEAYERVVLNALIRNPQLQNCDRNSLDIAVADCIQAGLLPDGKQAAIIPLKDTKNNRIAANFWPMMEGRTMLARRATPGLALVTSAVYAEDEFDVIGGRARDLVHVPKMNADKRDENVVAVYAMAMVPGATEWEWEVFDRGDIDRYRRLSRSDNVWKTNFAEMAKRGPLGRLLKRLPKDPRAPEPPELSDSIATGLDFGVIEGDSRVVDTDTGEIGYVPGTVAPDGNVYGASPNEQVKEYMERPSTKARNQRQKPEPPPPPIPDELPFDPDEEQQAELAAATDYDPDEAPF